MSDLKDKHFKADIKLLEKISALESQLSELKAENELVKKERDAHRKMFEFCFSEHQRMRKALEKIAVAEMDDDDTNAMAKKALSSLTPKWTNPDAGGED